MEDGRISKLNDDAPDVDGRYVLYWMQQAQRTSFNHALEYAARLANDHGVGLVVGFGLFAGYPEANARHFAFMLEGLAEVAENLAGRDIKFVVRKGPPPRVIIRLAEAAVCVVTDRAYLDPPRRWRTEVANEVGKQVIQVETDVVVPVEEVSGKQEYAARTIRPKLEKRWPDYLGDVSATKLTTSSMSYRNLDSDIDVEDWEAALASLDVDGSVPPSKQFRGGTRQAQERLTTFLTSAFDGYADARNDPAKPQTSMLSPYLHFGQISPVEIARKIRSSKSGGDEDKASFLEELIVRRELAINFTTFCGDYDSPRCLPNWARKTLGEHEDDDRPHRYTRNELENAKTHDDAWNAAMMEAVKTGYMHNYMRMYWAKKILEWSNTTDHAYRTTLEIMNKYFLDGRDPNSYAGVGWTYGLHDRAWTEREIYGKVRTMTRGGLDRKFDIGGYCKRIEDIEA